MLKWAQDDDAGGVGVERARNKAREAIAAGKGAGAEMGGGRKKKVKLGAEDIAQAVARERRQQDDVEDSDEDVLS